MNRMHNVLRQDLDHVLDHTELLWEAVRGERFFITGGTGFVGSWLMETLLWANRRLELGISAHLLTRNPAAFTGRSPHLACDPAVTLVAGDAVDCTVPDGTFGFVIHAATERYCAPDPTRPAATFDRDIAATRHILELTRKCHARRLLFTSSGAVYGAQPPELLQVHEDFLGAPGTTDTNSAYGQGKRISEFLCASYASMYGFETLIARLFAFVGPYLPLYANFAAGNFIGDVLKNEPVQILGDGTPFRSYLYAADMAIWLWTILFRGKNAIPYNVGSPDEISIRDLARQVVGALAPGTPIQLARAAVPGAPASRYVPSTKRAEESLGLHVWVPLEAAIQRTYDWHAEAPRTLEISA